MDAKDETVKKEDETPDEVNDEVIVDPEIEEALNFYRALKDPNQQKGIIADLAQRVGLIQEGEKLTKKESKTFADLIGDVLGEEYPDLKDKMVQIFGAYDAHSRQTIDGLKAELAQKEQRQQVETFESEFTGFLKDNKVTDATAAKMLKEIEELPPTVGKDGRRIPLTKYLEKIHRLVVGNNSPDKVVADAVKRNEKITQNLKDRNRNLTSDVDESRLKKGSQLPSIRESIAAAARGETFDDD